MLEVDAKNKFCPFLMGREELNYPNGWNCEGSGCMAWEWDGLWYSSKSNPQIVISEIQFKGKIKQDDGEKALWNLLDHQGDCGMKPPALECKGGY